MLFNNWVCRHSDNLAGDDITTLGAAFKPHSFGLRPNPSTRHPGAMIDAYDVLGIQLDCKEEDVKKAQLGECCTLWELQLVCACWLLMCSISVVSVVVYFMRLDVYT